MKVFTYNDYIKTIHTLRLNEIFRMAEESAEYNLKGKKENNTKEKTKVKQTREKEKFIENLLENREEMANFINTYLFLNEKISGEDLSKYTNANISKKFKSKPPKVIYKQKDSEKFFVVEHLRVPDATMPYRVLNFCVEIIYEWSKTARFKKISKYPKVVPIVIYTGEEKWKACRSNKRKEISTKVFENYEINFEYNLIEI